MSKNENLVQLVTYSPTANKIILVTIGKDDTIYLKSDAIGNGLIRQLLEDNFIHALLKELDENVLGEL